MHDAKSASKGLTKQCDCSSRTLLTVTPGKGLRRYVLAPFLDMVYHTLILSHIPEDI
jgi:hypothetical protein